MNLKEQIERQLENKVTEWKAEIEKAEAEARANEARAEAEQADAEARRAAWEKIDGLKARVLDGKDKLAELRDATGDSLETLKGEIDRLVA